MPLNELEVHIFGGGAVGESIAIRLPTPQDKWGVVDSYAPPHASPEDYPRVKFLRERGVTELEFVALTHPHTDHFRGMSVLLQEFTVNSFWRFDGVDPAQIGGIIALATGEMDEDADELYKILKIRKAKRIPPQTMAAGTHLYPIPADTSSFSIRSIAPSGDDKEKYERSLKACFDKNGKFDRDLGYKLDHNLVSSALVIEFGDARIVLGGDVEKAGWEKIVRDHSPGSLGAQLVKVPHHGSTNGYCVGLWEAFGTFPCVAVVTTYASKGLPRRKAVEYISRFATTVYSTSVPPTFDTTSGSPRGLQSEIKDLPVDEQQVLRATFSNLQRVSKYLPGRCSFLVRSNGTTETSAMEGAAGILAFTSAVL